jgi:hypothetical protein
LAARSRGRGRLCGGRPTKHDLKSGEAREHPCLALVVLDHLLDGHLAEGELDAVPPAQNLVLQDVVRLQEFNANASPLQVVVPQGPTVTAVGLVAVEPARDVLRSLLCLRWLKSRNM